MNVSILPKLTKLCHDIRYFTKWRVEGREYQLQFIKRNRRNKKHTNKKERDRRMTKTLVEIPNLKRETCKDDDEVRKKRERKVLQQIM